MKSILNGLISKTQEKVVSQTDLKNHANDEKSQTLNPFTLPREFSDIDKLVRMKSTKVRESPSLTN